MNNPLETLNATDQSINLMYHLYAAVFDDMQLPQVDKMIFQFIPRCIWDNECDHYHTCMHELAWKQYSAAILDHVLQASLTIFPKSRKTKQTHNTDILDILVWCCYNSNISNILISMYTHLKMDQLIEATTDRHSELHKVFIKYLKLKEQST